MKPFGNFIKATVVGGLIAVLPLSLILLALGSLIKTMIAFGSGMEDYLPFGWLGNTVAVAAVAVIIIISLCFVTGLILLTGPGKRLVDSISAKLAEVIPIYGMVQSLTARFAGINTTDLPPVEADLYGAGTWVLGFLVEELPDGRVAIFVPAIPVATMGQMYYIDAARVRKLDVPMMDVVNAITQWGVGSKVLFQSANNAKSNNATE